MGIFDMFSKKTVLRTEKGKPFKAFDVVETVKGDFDTFHSKLLKYSLIMLINGKRGSGKTALGMRLLELFRKKTKRKSYILGYDSTKLPGWIKKSEAIEDVPNNAIVLVDEGGLSFSSRDSMKEANKMLGKIMAVARHKNLTLILITQNSAMIDLNVLRLADTLLLKEPSLLQSKFERKAIKEMYDKVAPHFEKARNKQKKFYVWDDEFEGMLSYELSDFWSDKISKSFKNFK
jgi:hypothetical protein